MGRPVHRTLHTPGTRLRRRTAGPGRRVRLVLRDLEDRTTPATFTVTNAADAGAGSLRQAITDSVAATTADTINFDTAGVFATAQTISLLSALPQITAAGGALTITGTGAANLTVRRDPGAATNFRIFDSTTPTLALTGMTVSGGNPASSADGGGLLAMGTTPNVTLDGVVFTGNAATAEGGAVYMNSGGLLTLRNSTISGNTAATDGGGIYFFSGGSFLIENSTISGNTANGTVGGGGIYFFGTPTVAPPAPFTANTLVIRNSTLGNNTSAAGGGAITLPSFATAGTLLVQSSLFAGNTAATTGGAISLPAGALTVQNSTLTGNAAGTSGGGIAVTGGAGAIAVQNSTLTGNRANGTAAGAGGGGLARTTTTAGTVTVANSVISGNANANGPDILTAASGSTVNVNFSALGSGTGFTPSGTSGNNLAAGTDLKLSVLANNGGQSRAMLPGVGSPLVNAGSDALIPAGLATDQRGTGFTRTTGTVDIGATEAQAGPPFIQAVAAPNITAPGSTYSFTVTFADDTAVNVGTLIGNSAAVTVTGPNGFSTAATYVGIDEPSDGNLRTVTYAVTPPGGAWDQSDNGAYALSLAAGQVADTGGDSSLPGQIGSFTSFILNFTVMNADDSGFGSLRQVLTDANIDPGANTVEFDPAFFSAPRTISLLSALPTVSATGGPLTIPGPGASLLTVRRDPAAASGFRVLDAATTSLTASGLTLSGGVGTTGGGLQFSAAGGTLRLTGVAFSGNTATANGGGLYVTGTGALATVSNSTFTHNAAAGAANGGGLFMNSGTFLMLQNSTVSGNTAGGDGGGLYFFSGGGLVVENSTVSGNTANGTSVGGGALYFFGTASTTPPVGFTAGTVVFRNSTLAGNTSAAGGGAITLPSFTGTLQVLNSTIAGNTAITSGGGIALLTTTSAGSVAVVNSTITGNTSGATAANTGGGGIARLSTTTGTVTVANSVVSGNTNANGPDILTAASGTTVDVNFSAVGSATGYTASGASGNNLATGTDLLLGPLANYGGVTRALSPLPGSPLIGAGSDALVPSGVTADQRGGAFVRSFGGTIDIGSVESQPPYIPIAVAAGSSVTTAGGTTYQFTVTYSDPTGTNNGINTGTVTGNNGAVRVTGPNGFDAPATFVSVDDASNGTPRTATYSITPPGGAWDVSDNGTYTVGMQANQVTDADGNFVAAGPAGSFAVLSPYVVTTDADAGAGSLRQAIASANATPAADVITFAPTFFNTPHTIALQTVLPQIVAAGGGLTIAGPGAAALTVRRDAAAATTFRVFDSLAPTLTLSGFTVSGGNFAGDGAGLQAGGIITLDRMTFTGNQATGANDGGAIRVNAGGFLTLRNSTLSGNSAGRDGGGVYFASGGSLVMENSSITGNSAAGTGAANGGGGVYFVGTASATPPAGFTASTLVVRNSTVSNNTSAATGGGVQLNTFAGTLLIQNSTLAGNTAGTSGGAVSQSGGAGSVTVQNSTVAGNTANGTAAGVGGGGFGRTSTTAGNLTVLNSVVAGNTNANGPDLLSSANTTTNLNYSAVGTDTGYTASGTSGNNIAAGTNLLLGPLGDHGGATPTLAPQLGSPLINAGSNADVPAALTTDQRGTGFDRVFGPAVDIGAFEVQPPRVTVNQAAGQPDPTSTPSVAFAVRFSGPVTGFTAAGVDLSGSTVAGTLSAEVTGSGADYTVTVTGMTGLGTVLAAVLPGSAADDFGAVNVASTSTDNVVTFDPIAPTVTINQGPGQGDPTKVGPITFTVTFSEPVMGFTGSDVSFAGSTVGGAPAAQVSGSGPTYTVTVTGMAGVGDLVASVPAGGVLDVAGNPNSVSTSTDNVVRFDEVGSTVTINQAAGQGDPTNGPVSFDVLFDEPVTGFGPADVDLSGSTTGGTLVSQVTGSGANYTVTVTGMAGPGLVVAAVPTGAALDLAAIRAPLRRARTTRSPSTRCPRP